MKKPYIIYAFLLALPVCAIATFSAQAQTRSVQLYLEKSNEVVIAPGETTQQIDFAFFSSFSSTSTLSIDLQAPNKSALSARSLGFTGNVTLESAVEQGKKSYLQEVAGVNGRFTKQVVVGSTEAGSNNQKPEETICNGASLAIYKDYFIEQYVTTFGTKPTSMDEVCDWLFGAEWRDTDSSEDSSEPGSTTTSNLGSLTATSHVLKDACDRKKSKYLVILSVNLSKISAEDRANGFTLTATVKENEYKGGQQSSLKPVSDGKFKGQPLLLMALISGNDRHMYTRWSNGKTKKLLSTNTKNLAKITPWRQFLLGATLPADQLRGGMMTAIAFDSQSAYGVCFSATRTRQRKNGYPA